MFMFSLMFLKKFPVLAQRNSMVLEIIAHNYKCALCIMCKEQAAKM